MYDPLLDESICANAPYPSSYWADVAGTAPEDDGQLNKDINVDVAIIGAGYTGLSTALHLAREHGIKATVLGANRTAWGASGRNAGFILKSSLTCKLSFKVISIPLANLYLVTLIVL